jgi:hypothetical protein
MRPEANVANDYDDVLRRHFGRVEHRDTQAYTLWESRDDLQAFLDAFVEMVGAMAASTSPRRPPPKHPARPTLPI